MHLRTLHPQFMGARLLWRPGMKEAELFFIEHSMREEPRFRHSPVWALYEGAEGIRQRLDLPADGSGDEYGIYADLRRRAHRLRGAAGAVHRRQAPRDQLGTDRPGGFTTADLVEINDALPVLAMATDPHEPADHQEPAQHLCRPAPASGSCRRHPARQRRDRACRDLELRSPGLHPDRRALAARRRDRVAQRVFRRHGRTGRAPWRRDPEIRRRRMLAIFRLESAEACNKALQAAVEAQRGMKELNAARIARGSFELGFGVALHVGDVMYGNIGTTRLDFTVIGPAVNVASRLQTLTKELRRQVLLSAPFAFMCGCSAEFLPRSAATRCAASTSRSRSSA